MNIKTIHFLLLILCNTPVYASPRRKPAVDSVRMKYFIDIAKREVLGRRGLESKSVSVDWAYRTVSGVEVVIWQLPRKPGGYCIVEMSKNGKILAVKDGL